MSREPFRLNDAQRFLIAQRAWLVRVATRILDSCRLPNIAEDIVQNLAIKCLKISNAKWRQIKNKNAYLARTIRNEVTDLVRKYHDRNQPLSDCIKPCTPIDAMEAGRLVQQVLQKLSQEEVELLEHVFEGGPWDEIARRLQITPAAARKRFERLKKKLRLLIQEKCDQE